MQGKDEKKALLAPSRKISRKTAILVLVGSLILSLALVGISIWVWVGFNDPPGPPPPLEDALMDMTDDLGLNENIPEVAKNILTPDYAAKLVASIATNFEYVEAEGVLDTVIEFFGDFLFKLLREMPVENVYNTGLTIGRVIGKALNETTSNDITYTFRPALPSLNATLSGLWAGLMINQSDPNVNFGKFGTGVADLMKSNFEDPAYSKELSGFMSNVGGVLVMFFAPVVEGLTENLAFEKCTLAAQDGIENLPDRLKEQWGTPRSRSYWSFMFATMKTMTGWFETNAALSSRWT